MTATTEGVALDLDRVRELVLEGATRAEIAGELGIGSRRTLLRSMHQDAALRACIEEAEADRSDEATAALVGGDGPQIVVTAYRLAQVIHLAGEGMSIVQIAREVFGVSDRALRHAREHDPRIDAAIAEGRAREETALVSKLLAFTEGDDRVALTAVIFALKSRHGHNDRGGLAEGRGDAVRIHITLPAAAPNNEAFARVIEATPTGVVLVEGGDDDRS